MRLSRVRLAPFCALCLLIGCSSTGVGRTLYTPWGSMAEQSPAAQAYAHYLSAIIYDQRGQRDRALREMEVIPELDPEAVTPTLQLVRTYLRQREFDKALEMADRAIAQRPDRPNLWIVRGELYHQLKRYDEAVAAFEKAIALNPDNMLGYGALVELQESTNDLVAAVDIYHRLIEMNPDAAGMHYQLGINLARINRPEEARAALVRALDLDPGLIRARYLLGVMYFEAGDTERAATQLESYLQARPADLNAKESLAAAWAREGLHAPAGELYAAIIQSGQGTPKHHILAMYQRIFAGLPDEAEGIAPPDGAPYFATLLGAIARQDQGLPHRAPLDGLDAIDGDLDAECGSHLNDLLYFYGIEKTGAWLEERVRAYREELPAQRALTFIHARLLMNLKRHAEAVEAFTTLLNPAEPDPTPHYYLAMAHEELDQFEQTETHLKAYLALRPDDPDMLNFLGYLYAEENVRLDEAEELLKKALAMDPENPYYLDSLGWIYYRMGRADDAIGLIQRAIYGMESDDAILRDHLGDAYLLKGDTERALAEWDRAHRLDPQLEGVAEKLERHRAE